MIPEHAGEVPQTWAEASNAVVERREEAPEGRMRMRVLLVTGGYYPAPGGAANYSLTLAHLLAGQGVAENVEVFTERYPGEPDYKREGPASRVILRRTMPWRATRAQKGMWSWFLYAFQLLQIARMLIKEGGRFDAILLHGSLIYRAGFLAQVIGIARRLFRGKRPRYILDIRDPLMPGRVAPLVDCFDGVVACARNVAHDLAGKGVPRYKIWEIPIPLKPHLARDDQQDPICTSFGLAEGGFVFVAHGFMPGKRTEEVVDAVEILREAGIELSLAVAGRTRYWPEDAERARREGWLHFLGPLPNSQVRGLMAECRIHVNVCAEEGMPRGSLEAISAGAMTVLPPGVPEFDTYCPAWVGTAGDPRRLSEEMLAVMNRGDVAPYPLERHDPVAVARNYAALFAD